MKFQMHTSTYENKILMAVILFASFGGLSPHIFHFISLFYFSLSYFQCFIFFFSFFFRKSVEVREEMKVSQRVLVKSTEQANYNAEQSNIKLIVSNIKQNLSLAMLYFSLCHCLSLSLLDCFIFILVLFFLLSAEI